jgi:hypothetical protein
MQYPEAASTQARSNQSDIPDAERLVGVVSDVARQFGFVRVETYAHLAQFRRESYPRIILTATPLEGDWGFRITIFDLDDSKETGTTAKLRNTLQPRLESAFPEYAFQFEESREDTTFAP